MYCGYPLHTAPPKGWADHLSHPSSRSPGPSPTFTPYKEPAPYPCLRERAREPVTSSRPPCGRRGPSRALPEFLPRPLISFY